MALEQLKNKLLGSYNFFTMIWDPEKLQRWAEPYYQRPGARSFLVKQLEALILSVRSLYKKEVTVRAAALTYNSLLAIVPLLAVIFGIFQGFGGLQQFKVPLQQFIVKNLAVGRAEEVSHWLERFVYNINAGAIAGMGVLFLFYSAMGLLTTIEESFNNIWGIQQGRSFITRIFMYWGIITLTPPLVGISISITARLQSSAFAATVLHWLPFGLGSLMLSLFTALTTCLAFTLSYYIIPNVKVRFGAALIGGILAGLLWNITKIVFINFVSTSVKYNAIYGALGILPILMLWIYISWIIVLFGVTYAAANQSMFAGELLSSMRMAPSFRELLAIEVALMSTDALVTGRPPLAVDDFSRQTGINGSLINNVLEVLVAHGILAKVQRDNEDVGYLPAKDPDDLSFDKIIRVLRQKDGLSFPLKQTIGSDEAISVLMEADQVSMQILARARLRVLAQKGRVTTLPTHQQCSIA